MLIFPLKKEWYEKIKSGEKTIEYREVKPYWTKRFNAKNGLDDIFVKLLKAKGGEDCDIPCKLRYGYTNRYMTARIAKIEIVDGKDTDLHIDKPVYAIHLADVKMCIRNKIKMPKKLDNELESYKQKIGRENFKNLYSRVYAKTLSNKRFSGRKYENSPEKLAAIKEKYKNGVSKEIINEILGYKGYERR